MVARQPQAWPEENAYAALTIPDYDQPGQHKGVPMGDIAPPVPTSERPGTLAFVTVNSNPAIQESTFSTSTDDSSDEGTPCRPKREKLDANISPHRPNLGAPRIVRGSEGDLIPPKLTA